MRPTILMTILVALLAGPLLGSEQRTEQSDLLREGKLALLDGRLQQAIEALQDLQRRFPEGNYFWDSVFFEARALERLRQKEEALGRYNDLVRSALDHPLREQAQLSSVELSVSLYEDGIEAYIEQALEALESSEEALKEVAALRLSYVEDRAISSKAVSVLQGLARSDDAELSNQATVALLRIDPELLQEPSEASSQRTSVLRLVLEEDGERISLNFPISLARMLVDALPASVLRELQEEEGIDARELMRELEKADGVIEVETRGFKLKIWIE